MEAQNCIMDMVQAVYLCQEEMTRCNVCYHEITHAFWELGNTALLVPSAHQEELSHDNKISKPKCLIPATKWQGKNKQ